MKSLETRQYEMLVRVRDFGEANSHLFPASSVAGEAFAAVAAAVTQLSEHAVSRMSTLRGGAAAAATARGALRDRLEAVVRTARVLREETPGLEDKFELPDQPADQELVTAGRLFARDAEPLKARFIAHALPETFLADLTQGVEQFEQAIRGRDAERDGNIAAKASIDAALEAGLAAVRKLDGIVANHLHDDRVTMAVWNRDRRVGYRNRPKAAAPAAPVASAVVPPSQDDVKAVA